MSDLCKELCFAYAQCAERSTEDPTEHTRAFRQMQSTKGLHTEAQITNANELLLQGERCASNAPHEVANCRIIAAAILKNAIG
jgi:hypothetical protein